MSLVGMKLRQPPITLDFTQTTTEEDRGQVPDVSAFMARVFGDPPAEAGEIETPSPRTFEVAFEVLKRGSEALREMQSRFEQLQSTLVAVTEQARFDLDASEARRIEWEQLAKAMIEKLETAQGDLEGMKAVAESEETRANAATARAEAAERYASRMEKVATALYDDILAGFGEAAEVLSAVQAGFSAENCARIYDSSRTVKVLHHDLPVTYAYEPGA